MTIMTESKESVLKQTPLVGTHRTLGAKLVPFGGWEMPVLYTSVLSEHHAVRKGVGLFDIGHMGQVEVAGPDALAFIQHISTNDAARLAPYQAHYSLLCNERGGVIDDFLVYRLPDRFLLVVNAGNTPKDWDWFMEQRKTFQVELTLLTRERTLFAVQGPLSPQILAPLVATPLTNLKYYWIMENQIGEVPVLISRTGYTGEEGFEIFLPVAAATSLWDLLLDRVHAVGGLPCGLGARDTLRLEAGMPLYGHEYTLETNPYQVGVGWAVRLEKEWPCVGHAALQQFQANPGEQKLVGLALTERAIPREGYPVMAADRTEAVIGQVTSGTLSPTLDQPIAMAFVPQDIQVGATILVKIRTKTYPATVVPLPFYRRHVKQGQKG